MKDLITIVCPKCGMHYMPAEIYYPDSFFGRQKDIMKSPDGEIDYYLGDDMNLHEEFICEGCGAKLSIEAKLSFDVAYDEEEEFNDEYVTKVKKNPVVEESLF